MTSLLIDGVSHGDVVPGNRQALQHWIFYRQLRELRSAKVPWPPRASRPRASSFATGPAFSTGRGTAPP
jgi:hypothetical protein